MKAGWEQAEIGGAVLLPFTLMDQPQLVLSQPPPVIGSACHWFWLRLLLVSLPSAPLVPISTSCHTVEVSKTTWSSIATSYVYASYSVHNTVPSRCY